MRSWTGRSAEERLSQEKEQIEADWKYYFGWDMNDPDEVTKYVKKREEIIKERIESETRKASENFEGETKMLATQERVRQRRARAYQASRK